MKTKIEVAKNLYKTANISSSSLELNEDSYQVDDKLLMKNEYPHPRQFLDHRMKGGGVKQNPDFKTVTLKLPYMSETTSSKILKFIYSKKLPITVVSLLGLN